MEINFITLLDIIKKGKKYFLIVFLVTFVLSAVVSFLLPVYYASTAILFPLSPRSYDPRSKFSYLEIYGSVEDVNRTIALAESGIIREHIIQKFNLAQHYNVNTSNTADAGKLEKEYTGNLEVKETNKGAVKITFYDKSPDTAAAVVNEIVSTIHSINKKVVEDAILKQFTTYQKVMLNKYSGLDSLNEILAKMRNMDKTDPTREVNSMEMFHAFSRLKETEVNLQAIQDDAQTLLVIEKAYPNRKKEKPQRMLIVALACIGTFIITLFFLLFREGKKEL